MLAMTFIFCTHFIENSQLTLVSYTFQLRQHSASPPCALIITVNIFDSGGARMFAARGKRLCCRRRQSYQFCNQGIFQDFGHGVWTNPWSPLLFSPLSFPPLAPHAINSSHSPLLPLPFLRNRPLNVGIVVSSPKGSWGGAPAKIEFSAF